MGTAEGGVTGFEVSLSLGSVLTKMEMLFCIIELLAKFDQKLYKTLA